MSYTQTLIDDFNDNSFDTTKWNRTNSTNVVEASTVMSITLVNGTNEELVNKTARDLSAGQILAGKISKSGTAISGTDFYINISDSATVGSGNQAQATSSGTAGTISWDHRGSTTVSGTNIGTPVGPTASSGWTAGTWWGIGNIGVDNIVHLYKSSDGQTWTEMSHATLGGTFSRTAVFLEFMTNDTSGSSGAKMVIDDASYFTVSTIPGKVRSGGAWVKPTAAKVRSGGAWVVPTTTKVRSGGAWVTPTN